MQTTYVVSREGGQLLGDNGRWTNHLQFAKVFDNIDEAHEKKGEGVVVEYNAAIIDAVGRIYHPNECSKTAETVIDAFFNCDPVNNFSDADKQLAEMINVLSNIRSAFREGQ